MSNEIKNNNSNFGQNLLESLNIKLVVGSILSIFLIFLLWESTYKYSCLSLIFPIIILLVISTSFISKKMQERICHKNCYINNSSILAKFLTSRIMVTIFYIIVSIFMAITIMQNILEFTSQLWTYFLIHIFLVIYLYKFFLRMLKNTINESFLKIYVREITINMSSLILFLVYVFIIIKFGYLPEYMDDTLELTLQNATNSVKSDCIYIDYILRIKTEIDASFWFMLNQGTEILKEKYFVAMVWLTFIFINGFALLGINRFIVQTVYFLDDFLNKQKDVYEK